MADKERSYKTDKSSLFAITGMLDRNQVMNALEIARIQAVEYLKGLRASLEPEKDRQEVAKQINEITLHINNLLMALPEVNVVVNAAGEPFGHTYIWSGCEELYYVLTGYNFDGTRREEKTVDPSWVPPPGMDWDYRDTETHNQRIKQLAEEEEAKDVVQPGKAWADYESLDEIIARLREKYEPKIFVKHLEPIVSIPGIEYTQSQIEDAKRLLRKVSTPNRLLYIESKDDLRQVAQYLRGDQHLAKFSENPRQWIDKQWEWIENTRRILMGPDFFPFPRKWNPEWDRRPAPVIPADFEFPKIGFIQVSPSFVRDPEGDEDKSTLCCRRAPSWITEEMIREGFAKFNTETRLNRVVINGRVQDVSFPQIRIQNDQNGNVDEWGGVCKIVLVCFSKLHPCEYDGLFALQMRKKYVVQTPLGIKGPSSATLIFSCWRNSPYQHLDDGEGERRWNRQKSGNSRRGRSQGDESSRSSRGLPPRKGYTPP